jgi:hypothetical protein
MDERREGQHLEVQSYRENRRLRVFENRVLRGIFGHNRNEIRAEWRRLHKEELNALCSSPNIFEKLVWCTDGFELAQDRNRWRAFVNSAMNS